MTIITEQRDEAGSAVQKAHERLEAVQAGVQEYRQSAAAAEAQRNAVQEHMTLLRADLEAERSALKLLREQSREDLAQAQARIDKLMGQDGLLAPAPVPVPQSAAKPAVRKAKARPSAAGGHGAQASIGATTDDRPNRT